MVTTIADDYPAEDEHPFRITPARPGDLAELHPTHPLTGQSIVDVGEHHEEPDYLVRQALRPAARGRGRNIYGR